MTPTRTASDDTLLRNDSSLAARVTKLRVEGDEIDITVADTAALRAVGLVGQRGPQARAFRVRIASVELPTATWRGALGHAPELLEASTIWPAKRIGTFTAILKFSEPVDLASVARVLVPAVQPYRPLHSAGAPRLAVDSDVPTATLAALYEPLARAARLEPNPSALLGSDVLIVRAGGQVPASLARQVLEVGRDGGPGDAGRRRLAMFDPFVHRPTNRTMWSTEGRGEARVFGDDLVIQVQDKNVSITLPLEAPLDTATVRSVRQVQTLDLTHVVAPAAPRPRHALQSRLVELVASGVALHSGTTLAGRCESIDDELEREISSTFDVLDKLSVARAAARQRRRAALAHAGYGHLDRALTEIGRSTLMPHVTALLVTNRPETIEAALGRLARQSYKYLDVVVAVHGLPAPDLAKFAPEIRSIVSSCIEVPADQTLGAALAAATRHAQGDLVTKFDDDDLYGPDHVLDLVTAHMHSGAQVVGKQPEFVYLENIDVTLRRPYGSERYSEAVAGGTILIGKGDLLSVGGWRDVPRGVDRALMQRVQEEGGLVYTTHALGFMYVRHGRGHTWNVDDSAFLKQASDQWIGLKQEIVEG